MSQEVILEQLQQYLEVTWVEYITRLQAEHADLKDADKIKQLQQQVLDQKQYDQIMHESLQRGHCFGLSICHAVMTLLGKQAWWEDALLHLYHWDGEVKSLDKPIQLRDARGGRTITLRQIFDLAFNYILHSHAVPVKGQEGFYPAEVTQQTALLPSAANSEADIIPPHMEIVDEDNKVRTIQKNQRVAGYFSKEQLTALLQEDTFKNNISLIHSFNHTIHVSYLGNGRWQLYDPNLSHESLEDMRIEGTKKEVIDAIFAQMGSQSLALEVAAIDPDVEIDLSAYDDFIRRTPAALLTVESLFLFAMEAPDRLQELLKIAARIPDGVDLKEKFARIITDAKYGMNRSALHLIAEYAPEALPYLFVLADQTRSGAMIANAIAVNMTLRRDDGVTPLQIMAKKSPKAMAALFALAINSGTVNFIHPLAGGMVAKVGKTRAITLDVMAKCSPAMLPALFDLANLPHSQPLRIELAKALHEDTGKQDVRLKHMIEQAPFALPELWKFLTKNQECRKLWRDVVDSKSPEWCAVRTEIANALSAEDINHGVVLHTIMRESPAEIRELIVLVLSDPQQPQNLIALLKALATTVDEKTGWQLITANMSEKDKAELLHMLSAKLNDVSTPDLVKLAGMLNDALTDDQSMFRGLCSERHKLFRGHYGKTSIWQELISKSQEILRKRKDTLKIAGAKDVLNIKAGR